MTSFNSCLLIIRQIVLLLCLDKKYNMDSIDNTTNQTELRKVQTIHGNSTFILVLPKDFVSVLNITKGDYVKCKILNNQLLIEKAEL